MHDSVIATGAHRSGGTSFFSSCALSVEFFRLRTSDSGHSRHPSRVLGDRLIYCFSLPVRAIENSGKVP